MIISINIHEKCMSGLFMKFRFVHPFRFRGDNARVMQNKFPWISIWWLVKPHAEYFVDIRKACWLHLAFADLYGIVTSGSS